MAKSVTILGLWHFTGRHTAARPSKCDAHGGRRVAHVVPRFHVSLQRVCCILFDVYITSTVAQCLSISTYVHVMYYIIITMYCVPTNMGTVRHKSRQGNTTNLNVSFSMENEKRAAQVGLEPTAYCLRGRCSTN